MSPVVVKEKGKAEKRKKDEKEKTNSETETVTPPAKQVKQDGKSKSDKTEEKQQKKVDVYNEILELELKESGMSTLAENQKMSKEICDQMRDLVTEIYNMKMKNGEKSKLEIKEKRIQAGLLFVKMKKLNRLEKLRVRTARENTNMAKQKVDEYNLQLQNLRYEVLHLKKEVSRCINFWSADEGVSMVDVNQFYAEAPKEISQPEKTKDDLHQQRLARLAWELETRKKLDAEAQELEDAKNQVDTQVLSKEEKVKDLGKQLGRILKATRPVQESLNLQLDVERAQKGLSVLLPEPLYILFSQADAYARGLDSLLNVEILGDFNKAKKFRMDVDDEDEEETADKKNQIFRVHPLSVVLKIKTKDDDEIDVTFTYLVHLEIVTVQGRVILKHLSASADILEASSILTQLYEEDDGSQSPNLKNEYQLKEAGISGDVGPMLRKTGFPFVWAQRLAGLNFLASSGPDKSISFLNMQKTVQKIRERFESRISLHEQIELLEQPKGFKPDSIPQDIIQLFPLKVSTKVKSWSSITWEKYCQFGETSSVCESGSVDSSDFLFKLVLNRGVASLTGLVCIKPDYPMSWPVFCLSLEWKDKWTAANNEWIRDLEREVNVESKKETEGVQSVLIYQVYKLMVLHDVLLEAVSSLDPEPLFTREKKFEKSVEGRMRKLPFVYNLEEKIFQQRTTSNQ